MLIWLLIWLCQGNNSIKFRLIVRKAAQLIDLNDDNKTVYSAMAKKVAT